VDTEQFEKLSFTQIWHLLKPGAVRAAFAIALAALVGAFWAGYGVRGVVDPLLHERPAVGHAQLRETAIGVADGVNRTFMMQRTPPDPAQVKVWLGGLLMDRDRYTISGRVLTFREDTIPAEHESVDAEY
jgi:hypothetical protein